MRLDQNPDSPLVRRMADAIEASIHRRLDHRLNTLDLRPDEFRNFFLGLRAESNRALSIVSLAYAEKRMAELWEAALNSDVDGGTKSLLNGFGPLSTPHARIELAAGLYWLSPVIYKNLRTLRKIRNRFAHDIDDHGFDSSPIKDLLGNMHPLEKAPLEAMRETSEPAFLPTPRQTFFFRTVLTCCSMIAELSTAPHASRLGLHPHAALRRDYEQIHPAILNLNRAAASVIHDDALGIKEEG